MSYARFHLILMVTHRCNLRCRYCYTGRKLPRSMTREVGRTAIDRAVRSLRPGGVLELGFFGGEPLLAADLVADAMQYARRVADARQIEVRLGLTTNGTVCTGSAWDYVRTGDPTRPDALLCLVDRVCYRETARVLRQLPLADPAPCLKQENRHAERRTSFRATGRPVVRPNA